MAGRPPKNSKQLSANIEQPKQKSYEELEAELKEMKDMMMSFLQAQKDSENTKQSKIVANNLPSLPSFKQDNFEEVHPNKRIKVISLYDGLLALVAGSYGKGKPYRFTKFGQTHNIIYSDLAEILHYQNRFAEEGLFYICDDATIYTHGLTDAYQKLLSKEIIDHLLDYEKKEMLELFKNSTKMQQEEIASVLARKIANDEDVDLNKVEALGKILGKSILDMSEDYKQVNINNVS